MNETEFLKKLSTRYPAKFADPETFEEVWGEYQEKLRSCPFRLDFNKLWDCIISEWGYKTTPSISWLCDRFTRCKVVTAPVETKTLKVSIPWRGGYKYEFEVPVYVSENELLYKLRKQQECDLRKWGN